jgi:20S proteasome alpha/beta subunit
LITVRFKDGLILPGATRGSTRIMAPEDSVFKVVEAGRAIGELI